MKDTVCLLMTIVIALGGIGRTAADNDSETRETQAALSTGNTLFAVALYGQLAGREGNLFFSPYSISTALAMTSGGARGATRQQMLEALRIELGPEAVHPAFRELARKIEQARGEGLVLDIANSLWPQRDYAFRDAFMALMKEYYDTISFPVDYAREPEKARVAINTWVEDRTQQRIKDLIAPGLIDELTTLVLVNAIYFKGDWTHPFIKGQTREAPFHLAPGEVVQVPMMTHTREVPYAETEHLQLLELPYAGGEMSMLIILPKERHALPAIERDLVDNPERLSEWMRLPAMGNVEIYLPRFKIEWGAESLVRPLVALGMRDAFRPGTADFSGMDGTRELFISDVVHKAFVEVGEEGTEAAAATGVIIARRSAVVRPTPVFRADHPFLFVIRENSTGSVLFMGRLSKPEGKGEQDTVKTRVLPTIREFRGSQALLDAPAANLVARNQRQWEQIWRYSAGTQVPQPEMPEIDFDVHMVIAVFMGQRSSGGYAVTIDSVTEKEDHVEVRYTTRSPGHGDMVTTALTSPFHIVVVPASAVEDVRFIEQ